ncbi:MAG: flagellar export chaperone FliS [Candidatus Krumholzibacteriia bacterium]
MPDATGIRCYQETAVQTIGPEKLIVLLYEGLVRYLNQARAALVARDMAGKARQINNAQAVVLELRNALDHEAGGTLAGNLAALYNYIFAENMNALIDNDPRHIDNNLRVIRPLLDAWSRIPAGTAERARREREASAPEAAAPTGPVPATPPPLPAPAGLYGRSAGSGAPAPGNAVPSLCVTV